MDQENQIFGIRAIIEAIEAGKDIDKVFLQKDAQGELMNELIKSLKRNNINFSYVPIEKLNRLTKKNHQGAIGTIAPITFVTLETLVETIFDYAIQEYKPLNQKNTLYSIGMGLGFITSSSYFNLSFANGKQPGIPFSFDNTTKTSK